MSDPIGAIDTTQMSGSGASPVDMAELNKQRYEEESKRTEFDDLMQRTINVAIDRPGGGGNISEQRNEFLGGRSGDVGEAKSELVSDVARAGTETSVEENKELESSLEERVMGLYSDLTDYQVAWRIAQKIPQDLSQILKGN